MITILIAALAADPVILVPNSAETAYTTQDLWDENEEVNYVLSDDNGTYFFDVQRLQGVTLFGKWNQTGIDLPTKFVLYSSYSSATLRDVTVTRAQVSFMGYNSLSLDGSWITRCEIVDSAVYWQSPIRLINGAKFTYNRLVRCNSKGIPFQIENVPGSGSSRPEGNVFLECEFGKSWQGNFFQWFLYPDNANTLEINSFDCCVVRETYKTECSSCYLGYDFYYPNVPSIGLDHIIDVLSKPVFDFDALTSVLSNWGCTN